MKDLFYNCSNSRDLVWYDSAAGVWNEAQGGNGSVLLKDYITKVLQRRLTTYSCRRSSCFHLDELRWDFGNKSFRDGVEACLRSQLPAPANFTLDPESSRRYLNFCGTVWDRELEAFVPSCPAMLISRTTGWVYSGYDNPGKDALDAALALVRRDQDETGLDRPAAIGDEAQRMLEEAAKTMPELRFCWDVTKEWELTVFLLMHLARGVFCLPMAEALFVRSCGRSGKDTTCNIVSSMLGTYAVSIAYDSLCSVVNPDLPCPTFASLRARRFVAVREVGTQKMQTSLFKKFVDPVSELSGRNLYDTLVRFKPQYLAFFCSNQPVQMESKDAAVKARTAIIDYASIFTSVPTEANHQTLERYDPCVHRV